jgi:hypothetical protein
MGKSDPFVFSWYIKNLPDIEPKKIAILGSTTDNFVRFKYPNSEIHLFDIQLDNWSINEEWEIEKEFYDLVVCTRCAYFAKEPNIFISKCLSLLKIKGYLFVDWGLGDHWRFKNYKVGWKKDLEHEYAYYQNQNYFLYSCLWCHEWENNLIVKNFKINIEKFGYNEDIQKTLKREIPSLLEDFQKPQKLDFLFLWPESPQLYILTIFKK